MTETVKIDASVIGIKKPIEVPTTRRSVRAALVFNRDLMEMESEDATTGTDFDPIAFVNSQIKQLDLIADYIKVTLKLTDKQAEAIDDIDIAECAEFGREIAGAVLHMEPEDGTEETADQKSPDKV